jgi:hypothetical protein
MSETKLCEHGLTAADQFDDASWDGAVGRCSCCGGKFRYIEKAVHDQFRSHGTSWVPKDRCGTCGGGYQEWESIKS